MSTTNTSTRPGGIRNANALPRQAVPGSDAIDAAIDEACAELRLPMIREHFADHQRRPSHAPKTRSKQSAGHDGRRDPNNPSNDEQRSIAACHAIQTIRPSAIPFHLPKQPCVNERLPCERLCSAAIIDQLTFGGFVIETGSYSYRL